MIYFLREELQGVDGGAAVRIVALYLAVELLAGLYAFVPLVSDAPHYVHSWYENEGPGSETAFTVTDPETGRILVHYLWSEHESFDSETGRRTIHIGIGISGPAMWKPDVPAARLPDRGLVELSAAQGDPRYFVRVWDGVGVPSDCREVWPDPEGEGHRGVGMGMRSGPGWGPIEGVGWLTCVSIRHLDVPSLTGSEAPSGPIRAR